jgi:hypothetical protein
MYLTLQVRPSSSGFFDGKYTGLMAVRVLSLVGALFTLISLLKYSPYL